MVDERTQLRHTPGLLRKDVFASFCVENGERLGSRMKIKRAVSGQDPKTRQYFTMGGNAQRLRDNQRHRTSP